MRCKSLRQENITMQTKIKIDNSGFKVQYKNRGDTYYREMPRQMIGELPDIEIITSKPVQINITPPKGLLRILTKEKKSLQSLRIYLTSNPLLNLLIRKRCSKS